MTDIKSKVGLRVTQLRKSTGMTQAKLADKANLSIDSISRLERGDRAPSLESMERIAMALDVEPIELLNFRGKEFKALAEGPLEALELWNLLRNKKRDQIKKICDIAKLVLS